MSTAVAQPETDSQVIHITREMHVRASLATTFAALLEQLGPGSDTPDGRPMPLVLEAWPGGRWFRDLGNGDGHCWGHVQAIKRPTLLEIHGPLFMSFAVVSNVQYRLQAVEGGTIIAFHHYGFGVVPAEHLERIDTGWNHILDAIRLRSETH